MYSLNSSVIKVKQETIARSINLGILAFTWEACTYIDLARWPISYNIALLIGGREEVETIFREGTTIEPEGVEVAVGGYL